ADGRECSSFGPIPLRIDVAHPDAIEELFLGQAQDPAVRGELGQVELGNLLPQRRRTAFECRDIADENVRMRHRAGGRQRDNDGYRLAGCWGWRLLLSPRSGCGS